MISICPQHGGTFEYTYNQRKICNGCGYLELDKDSQWVGTCQCEKSRVREKRRHVTDRACSYKRTGGGLDG